MTGKIPEKALEEAAHWYEMRDELSTSEQQAFLAWLNRSRHNALAYARISSIMLDPALLDAVAETSNRRAPPLRRPAQNASTRRHGWAKYGILATAACAAISLLAIFALEPSRKDGGPVIETARYTAPPNALGEFALPDGSIVKLNAKSSLNTSLSENERLLSLEEGNALFDVAPNPAAPFKVLAGGTEVTAVGTLFEVDCLSDMIEVTLYEGKVSISSVSGQMQVFTAPASAKILANGDIVRAALPVGEKPDWVDGWLVADNMSLKYALERMNRYRDQPIKLQEPEIGAEVLSGRFRLDDPDRSLELVTALLRLKVEEEQDATYLMRETQELVP